ncbi:DUF4412 domain-containing protein [Termitidicoccus mucosus]|uniref:DUF4412 domain-containing protein n=1 Tax=Termitidicoccus mucosus TaxID=1184151 RepID=A0A178IH97_9BACT|nr:hypothetical protein AW736_14065 [Opitutaceae bacterium TSB47]
MNTHNKQHTKPLALAAALLITLGALAAPASAASDFEGRIDMKISNPQSKENNNAVISTYIKMPKLRIEMNAALDVSGTAAKPGKKQAQEFAMTIITDTETEENLILMPQQKMYMVSKGNRGNASASGQAEDAYKPTGRTDTILGHRVEEYASTGSGEYTEMWLASGLGAFRMAGTGPNARQQEKKGWEKFLEEKGLFPLKVTTYKKEGDDKMMYQMEVIKIEKGSQPDSLFVPPADYKRLDMGGMFGGMSDAMKDAAAESAKEGAKDAAKQKAKSSVWDRLKNLGK